MVSVLVPVVCSIDSAAVQHTLGIFGLEIYEGKKKQKFILKCVFLFPQNTVVGVEQPTWILSIASLQIVSFLLSYLSIQLLNWSLINKINHEKRVFES